MRRFVGFLGALALACSPVTAGSEGSLIGPGGGSLVAYDGAFVLDVPRNALDENTFIAVHRVDEQTWEHSPDGLVFDVPARLSVRVEHPPAPDAHVRLYVADRDNHALRRIQF
ncbi:MAG: hypothetical protein H6721_31270 [Sandaracinus sp.]|nr:hypothetical protein [Sandaracinus sp.]